MWQLSLITDKLTVGKLKEMETLRFSVIVPVYNTLKYLRKCLDSIINQSFKGYELILVDDGSTDASGSVCDEYSGKFNNVFVLHKKNQGQIAARLDGVRQAKGEYIVFADSDDTLEKNALEILNSKIERYNPDGVIYQISRMTAHGLIKVKERNSFDDNLVSDKASLYRIILETPSYYSMCRKTFRKSMFRTTGFENLYDMRIGEDFFQTMDLISNASSVLFVSDCLYNYRNNPVSTIHKERAAGKYKTDFRSALFVMDLIKKKTWFSDEDMKEQLVMSLHGIMDRLEEISNLRAGYERKRELFEQIKNEPYYLENIQKLGTADLSGIRKKMYELFLNSEYKKLIAREKVINFPKRFKHFVSVIL